MKKPLFGSLNTFSEFYSLLFDAQNINFVLPRTILIILFTSSFFLIVSPQLKAQIVIKEKVEIGSQSISDFQVNSSLIYRDSVVSGFIIPRSGALQIYYAYLNHFDAPMPDYSSLNIYFFKGDSTKIDSLSHRFTSLLINPRYIYDYCIGQFTTRYEWMYTPPELYLYDVGSVSKDDTVQFIYHSDMEGQEFDFGILDASEIWVDSVLVGWDVTFGYVDYCIWEYANILQLTIGIIKDYELIVEIEPEVLYPGDTANVIIKKKLPDGTIQDFDSTQTFEIAKLDGCMLGNILAEGDSGAYFYDVTQPIYFAAADSLVGDTTGTVLLRVGVIENNKSSPEYIAGLYESNTCFTGNFNSTTHKDITFEVKEPLEIIYPTLVTIERITDVPEMPTVVCKARLKKYYPETIKYEWKYIVRKFYARRTLQKNPVCERISKSEFHGISYSSYGGEVTEWTVPFIKDSGYFYFKSLQPAKNIYDPLNHIYGCNGDTNAWYDTNDEIFTGGEVLITLIAKSYQTGEILARLDTVKLGKILGDEPGKPQIISYTNDNVIRAIQEFESEFKQFEYNANNSWPYNETGWPLYGEPNGYGIMQLDSDPAATERQLWNWKANIDGGKYKFYVLIKERDTDPFLNQYPQNVTEEMRLKCAYQKYNYYGGKFEKKLRYYYKWDREEWVENDLIPDDPRVINGETKKYGEWVYEIYSNLN